MGGRRGNSSEVATLDWARLGEKAMRAFKRVPAPSFL